MISPDSSRVSDPTTPDANGALSALDGAALRALIAAGARAVEANRAHINALNVFPVPDGDTGTNMSMTLNDIRADADANPSDSAGDTARRMARSALLAARGNSGLIMAQLFKGLSVAAGEAPRIGPSELAAGFEAGAKAAYSSVPDPREGTMLTVMREAAEAAREQADAGADIIAVLQAAVERSKESVARTPTLLQVLRDAGVVDSGGYGLSVLLSGALEYLQGRGDGASEFLAPPPIGVDRNNRNSGVDSVRREFVAESQEEIYGYCTVFLIEADGALSAEEIRGAVNGMGKSAVVAGDEDAVKIHIHVLDPGPVISYGASLGTLAGITILNMDEQTAEWAAEQTASRPQLNLAVVAVAAGDGICRVFTEAGLGACSLVTGGDSMNPSVEEILRAVESAPSDTVIILPNNRNVIITARHVPELTDKTVYVVPTRSIQQGIAALLAMSPDQSPEECVDRMSEAMQAVRCGAVCRAVRDATMSGMRVTEGQTMGLLDESLVTLADGPEAALLALARAVGDPTELVTIYAGEAVSREEAERAADLVREVLPEAEVELVPGNQPHYEYLVAFE